MNNTPPIFQQLLNSICPPAAQADDIPLDNDDAFDREDEQPLVDEDSKTWHARAAQ